MNQKDVSHAVYSRREIQMDTIEIIQGSYLMRYALTVAFDYHQLYPVSAIIKERLKPEK